MFTGCHSGSDFHFNWFFFRKNYNYYVLLTMGMTHPTQRGRPTKGQNRPHEIHVGKVELKISQTILYMEDGAYMMVYRDSEHF
jgi:hypothetical protein